ncbi:hypothetical protein ACLK19_05985 [Escherichia coli]
MPIAALSLLGIRCLTLQLAEIVAHQLQVSHRVILDARVGTDSRLHCAFSASRRAIASRA